MANLSLVPGGLRNHAKAAAEGGSYQPQSSYVKKVIKRNEEGSKPSALKLDRSGFTSVDDRVVFAAGCRITMPENAAETYNKQMKLQARTERMKEIRIARQEKLERSMDATRGRIAAREERVAREERISSVVEQFNDCAAVHGKRRGITRITEITKRIGGVILAFTGIAIKANAPTIKDATFTLCTKVVTVATYIGEVNRIPANTTLAVAANTTAAAASGGIGASIKALGTTALSSFNNLSHGTMLAIILGGVSFIGLLGSCCRRNPPAEQSQIDDQGTPLASPRSSPEQSETEADETPVTETSPESPRSPEQSDAEEKDNGAGLGSNNSNLVA